MLDNIMPDVQKLCDRREAFVEYFDDEFLYKYRSPSSAEFENTWSHVSTPHFSVASCLIN
jgi:hypothetical protein